MKLDVWTAIPFKTNTNTIIQSVIVKTPENGNFHEIFIVLIFMKIVIFSSLYK